MRKAVSSARLIIGVKAFSLSSAEISSPVGIISETVRIVAAFFPKYFALANKAKASISTAEQLYFAAIAGVPGTFR